MALCLIRRYFANGYVDDKISSDVTWAMMGELKMDNMMRMIWKY